MLRFFCSFRTQNLAGVGFHLSHSLGLGLRFEAFGANFYALAVHFFGLQIDGEFAAGGNVGMAAGISGSRSAIADITYSRHSSL